MRNQFFVASIALSFAICEVAANSSPSGDYVDFRAIGSTGDTVQIEQAVAKAATLWPHDIKGYCMRYEGLIMGLNLAVKKKPEDIVHLELLVRSLLEKEKAKPAKMSSEASTALLGAQRRALSALLGSAELIDRPGEDRMRYAALAASFVSNIGKEVIPNFKPKRVYSNVMPPIRSGPGAPGMSPDAIKDTVARTAYLQAIEENERNNAMNARQRSLRNALQLLGLQISDFVRGTLAKYPEFKGPAEEILRDSNLNNFGIAPWKIPGQH